MRVLMLLVTAALATAPAFAQTSRGQTWLEELARLRTPRTLRPAPAAVRANPVAESEPNNTTATADSFTVGDRPAGVVNPEGDVDAWAIELQAGQFVSIDLDAQAIGSPLDSKLGLFAPDGVTQLAFNDDFEGFDSRISYLVPVSGRYYVLVGGVGSQGGPELAYAFSVTNVVCGAGATEHEPNDAPAAATPVTVGDSATGEICPNTDADFWAFTVSAGTAVELDVDAAAHGLLVDPALELYDGDGRTRLSFNDDAGGADPRLQFAFATAGTYYARVEGSGQPGANSFPYTLHVRAIVPGPGDPIAVRTESLSFPFGLTVGKTGDLFVGDIGSGRIVRVTTAGQVTTVASGINGPLGLAFDAFDNLLVATLSGVVYRITAQGDTTPFITDTPGPFWIAVANDGRIWLTDVLTRTIRRYSPTGQFETHIDAASAGGIGPGPIALGPSGDPYVSTGNEIWRVQNGQLRRVVADGVLNWAFAFDAQGNLYVPQPTAGRIRLFDSTGTVLAGVFAVSPDGPRTVAFGRDPNGTMNARLFVTDATAGRLLELNPAGARARGLPVGFVAPPFSLEIAAAALLGAGGLSAADRQYLDALGNHNGRYDVGDLRALLRTLNGRTR